MCRPPHPRQRFFKQAVFQRQVSYQLLHVPHLAAQFLALGRQADGVEFEGGGHGLYRIKDQRCHPRACPEDSQPGAHMDPRV